MASGCTFDQVQCKRRILCHRSGQPRLHWLPDDQETIEWLKNTEDLIKKSKNIKILKDTLVTTYNFKDHLIAIEDKAVESAPTSYKSGISKTKLKQKTKQLEKQLPPQTQRVFFAMINDGVCKTSRLTNPK